MMNCRGAEAGSWPNSTARAPNATCTAMPTDPVVSAPRQPQRRVAATSANRNHASTASDASLASETYTV